jgi:hypothetical protein
MRLTKQTILIRKNLQRLGCRLYPRGDERIRRRDDTLPVLRAVAEALEALL